MKINLSKIRLHQQTEDALAESEKKLRTLYETMSEGIVYEDHDGKIISANPAAERLLGLSFDQMQGRTSVDPRWKAIHADGSPFPGETHSLNVAAKTGKPTTDEVMGIYNPKSGAYVWLNVTSTPEFLPGEKMPFRAFAVFRDITCQKLAEEMLQKSEKQYRLLFDEMLSGFALHEIICDQNEKPKDYRFLSVNAAFEKMTGLDAHDILGKTAHEVLPGIESSWIERYGKVALTGDPIQFENYAATLGKYYEVHAYCPEHGKFATLINDITERKRMDDALHESETKLLALINAVNESVFLMEIDGTVLAVNETTATRLGVQTTDIIGHNIYSFLPLDVAEKRRSYVEQVITTGKFVRFEDERFEKLVDNSIYPVKDRTGAIKQVAVYGYDITERKRAEIELMERHATLNAILESATTPVFSLNNDYHYTSFNNAHAAVMKTLYGAEIEIGHSMLDYQIVEADREEARKNLDRALHGEQIVESAYSGDPSHTSRYFEITHNPIRNFTGQIIGVSVFVTDLTERKYAEDEIRKLNIELERRVDERTAQLQSANKQLESELTERKRAEEALRQIEQQFHRLSEAAFEAIIIHDRGVLLSSNNQYNEMFGYEQEELVGKQVMPLTIAPGSIEGVKKMIATGGVGPYESIGLRKDGTMFPMEIRVREMEYEGRKVRVAAIMDITERKRVEQALQQRTNQLESANKELEAFSYSVSHDLRAPLRGIDGWSQALLEDYGNILDGQAKTYLDRVRSETRRMSQLIDDLLQLSRLTSTEMTMEKVNLSDMAGTIAAHLHVEQPDRHVKFSIQQGMFANVDSRLLEIALSNLLGNSFKFTCKTTQAYIEFGQTEIDGQQVFFVRDNGAGFDMAQAKNLFGAFQRMHRASEFPGSGIGLSTVQRIIHRHGGRIWADAAINQGATFYFTLEELP